MSGEDYSTKGKTPENPHAYDTKDLPGQWQRDAIAFTAMAAARQRNLYAVMMVAEIVPDEENPDAPEGKAAYKMKASIQCNCDPHISLELAAAISRWANARAAGELTGEEAARPPNTDGGPGT